LGIFIPFSDYPPTMYLFVLLADVIAVCIVIVIIDAIVSWVSCMGGAGIKYYPMMRRVNKWATFLSAPVRRFLKPVRMGMGFVDFSPLVTAILLSFLQTGVMKLGISVTGPVW